MKDFPKRARCVDWRDGALIFDNGASVEAREPTIDIMERLGALSGMVGFHACGVPLTDELIQPLAGLKNMVNLGVTNGLLTDGCFPIFASMPKLQILLLDGNSAVSGAGLDALVSSKVNLISLNDTALDDGGLTLAASLPKLAYLHAERTAYHLRGHDVRRGQQEAEHHRRQPLHARAGGGLSHRNSARERKRKRRSTRTPCAKRKRPSAPSSPR